MTNFISVIIPTFNPNSQRLNKTLAGLKNQSLEPKLWELIIVDNNSENNFAAGIDLSWHKNAKLIEEKRQGLTFARVRGFLEAKGDILVLVDDDNILDEDYLLKARDIFNTNPTLGAIGGKSIPIFEGKQPAWLIDFYGNLALRDFGDIVKIESWECKYPAFAPIGAGMAIKKPALSSYISKITSSKTIISDRNGNALGSSGDNDIILDILKSGWQIGYFPGLILYHLIPGERLKVGYLARLLNQTNRSWIQLLENHEINPWRKIPGWTVPIRKVKAWFTYKAWRNPSNFIKWRGACGTFEGLAKVEKEGIQSVHHF